MVNFPRVTINTDMRDGLCFGCGVNNPFGLKLKFEWDGKKARAEFTPHKYYQGWPGIMHGGVIMSLLDEAMVYVLHFKDLKCLTAKMRTRFKRPAFIDEPLIITASMIKNARRLIETKASVALRDGTLVAEGIATQFIINGTDDNGVEEAKL